MLHSIESNESVKSGLHTRLTLSNHFTVLHENHNMQHMQHATCNIINVNNNNTVQGNHELFLGVDPIPALSK